MAFLDKFNDWYNKAVSDDEPGVRWMEPVEGSRYRWKQNWYKPLLAAALVMGVMLLPLPGKHGQPPSPLPIRLITGTMFGCVILVVGWASSYTKTAIFLNRRMITVGTGRSRRTVELNDSMSLRMERAESGRVLIFEKQDSEELRVFLGTDSESEVLDFLATSGLISAEAAGKR